MAYERNLWSVGMAITLDKMLNIEQGIYDASNKADTNATNIAQLTNNVSQASQDASDAKTIANNVQASIEAINPQVSKWDKAYTEVAGVIPKNGAGEFSGSLKDVIDGIGTQITTVESGINTKLEKLESDTNAVLNEVTDARGDEFKWSVRTGKPDTLNERLEDMDSLILTNQSNANTAMTSVRQAAGSFNSLQGRLNAIDGGTYDPNTTPAETGGRLGIIETELSQARNSSTNNSSYPSLDDRFEANEAAINSKVSQAKIVENLTTVDNTTVLSGNQGPAIVNAINDGVQNAKDYAKQYADTNKVDKTSIANNDATTTEGFVLDARRGKALRDDLTTAQGDITTIQTDISDIESDISGIQTEIANAHRTQNDTLDTRFDNLETSVTNIANELNMTNIAGEIADTHTRIDTIEANVVEMGKEIGMIQDGAAITALSDVVDRSTTRIDAIEGEVNAAHRDGTVGDTLDNRFDDIETDVSNLDTDINGSGGVKDRLSAAETKLNSIPDGSAIADMESTLDSHTEAIAGLETSIAIVESSNTAVHDIAEGLYVLWKDSLYRATTAISINDTLSTLTNLARVDNGLANIVGANANAIAANTSAIAANTSNISAHSTAISNLQTAIAQNSTTVIIRANDENLTYENNIPVYSGTIDPYKDYLIENPTDGKFYYWKYIDNAWALISGGGTSSGGGGTGNNSSQTFNSYEDFIANAVPNANTDYYVLQNDKYHHYRYIQSTNAESGELEWNAVEIGSASDISTNNIKTYNIALRSVQEPESPGSETLVVNNYLYLFDFDYGTDNNISDTAADERIANNNYVKKILLPATGGGGGLANLMRIYQITPRIFTAAANGANPTLLRFFFTTGESGARAYYTLTIDGKAVETNVMIIGGDPADASYSWPTSSTIPAGFFSIDITNYVKTTTTHTIRLDIVSEVNSNLTASADWSLSLINFYLLSDAAEGRVINIYESAEIPYTPVGSGVDKTLHIIIDNGAREETDNIGTSTGIARVYTMGAQSHGSHKIDIYMTADASGILLESNHITREYIWYNPEDDTAAPVIIASQYKDTTMDVTAYETINIPYSVYHKEAGEYNVEYYLNYGTENQSLIDIEKHTGNISTTFSYIPIVNTNVTLTVTIKVEDVILTVTLNVTPLEGISPVDGAIIDFDPSAHTNNSIDREPEFWRTTNTTYNALPQWSDTEPYSVGAQVIHDGYVYRCVEAPMKPANSDTFVWDPTEWSEVGMQSIYLKASDNFNWSSVAGDSGGGYRKDGNDSCFVIKAGSYVDINYKMFKSGAGQTVFDTGAEMKLIFKVKAVRQIDAVWFNNTAMLNNKPVGIKLQAHQGELRTDRAADATISIEPDENGQININGTIYTVWKPNTAYAINTIVVVDDSIYKCKKAHTSGEEFADDNWSASGKIDTSVLATNSYLYFPYSEEDKIELDININKHNANSSLNTDFIMSYEDGVPSKAYAYTYGSAGDGLRHTVGQEATIRIGSPDCDVYIYRMRVYNKALTDAEVLQNFIADGATIDEKRDRYDRNCIYWDGHQYSITKSAEAKLDPLKLAEKIPNVKILMLDTPTFTTGKKNFVRSTLRCIQSPGGTQYAATANDNWLFLNGYHSGQGTTSDNYGQSGRNVDFLFECDGVNAPAKKKNIKPEGDYKGYQSMVLKGDALSTFVTDPDDPNYNTWIPTDDTYAIYDSEKSMWEPTEAALAEESSMVCKNWKGDNCKIQLTPTSVPNNYFNLKVNIASSENVNNALFQKRYNDFLTATVPATAVQNAKHDYVGQGYPAGITVKNSMEFVPAVLFVRESDPTQDAQGNYINHNEFNDTEWHKTA